MSLQKNTQIANRYGLNLRLCDSDDINKVYQTIDFANISSTELNEEIVYAHGGAARAKRVGFYGQLAGELTVSTQILSNDLLCLMAGGAMTWDGKSPIVFKHRIFDLIVPFTLIGNTVWQDKDGNTYEEQLVFHRVLPRIAYTHNYSIENDVANVDIIFDVLADDDGNVLTRGDPEFMIFGRTLATIKGYVTADGTWALAEGEGTQENEKLILHG